MARDIDAKSLEAIEEIVRAHFPGGMSVQEIAAALKANAPPRRTLQYQLRQLVDQKRLLREGERRGSRYRAPSIAEATSSAAGSGEAKAGAADITLPLSKEAKEVQAYVRQPVAARKPVGYDRDFLDAYRPNETFYLTKKERAHLHQVGTPQIAPQPAGTYAKQILGRLLIDLAWNSSRLEGNTYSLLDTRRLIDLGQEVEGKDSLEAQMILNHKDAIEFLVGDAEDIGFNRYTILNLHALLANNLLADPDAPGRLRRIPVGIERSVFHPLELPQLIEEYLHELLGKAVTITDPFEQAFFVMAQLPYLQPFDDVNKRVSRLAASIPMIRHNLAPLSFIDVPRETYLQAVLGVYELRRTEMLRDVFIWAYERSARATPPCGNHSVNPMLSACNTAPSFASSSAAWCARIWDDRRRRSTSPDGQQSISRSRTGSGSARLPKVNCWVCTRATSLAIKSSHRNSKPGARSGTNECHAD